MLLLLLSFSFLFNLCPVGRIVTEKHVEPFDLQHKHTDRSAEPDKTDKSAEKQDFFSLHQIQNEMHWILINLIFELTQKYC